MLGSGSSGTRTGEVLLQPCEKLELWYQKPGGEGLGLDFYCDQI